MITIESQLISGGSELVFRFPEVHERARLGIAFERTMRVPDDGDEYPLPAGLGALPLSYVEDHANNLSGQEVSRGGVLMPMYQSEATWIDFSGHYPMAVKIAAGKINAVTGESWTDTLHSEPQDYMTTPRQPWIDGFYVDENTVRQFVAEPLGQGKTVEEIMTGVDEWGGLQIVVYPMKAEEYKKRFEQPVSRRSSQDEEIIPCLSRVMNYKAPTMGLAAGGRISQKIYKDPYDLSVWDLDSASRCFVHIVNSEQYQQITGQPAPHRPITKKEYLKRGIPWFDHYGEGKALPGGDFGALTDKVVSVGQW